MKGGLHLSLALGLHLSLALMTAVRLPTPDHAAARAAAGARAAELWRDPRTRRRLAAAAASKDARRALFDVALLASRADASLVDGDCACPLTADACAESTLYGNASIRAGPKLSNGGGFKMRVLCAPRRAGVFPDILSAFW